jgi:predicted deacetylase
MRTGPLFALALVLAGHPRILTAPPGAVASDHHRANARLTAADTALLNYGQ